MEERKLVWRNVSRKEHGLIEMMSNIEALNLNYIIRNWLSSRDFISKETIYLICEDNKKPFHFEYKSIDKAKEKAEELYSQSISQFIEKDLKSNYGIDAEVELLNISGKEIWKSREEKYSEIKEILNIESFMNATNNNLDMLFKYMFSPTNGIRLSNIQVGEFIKDEYGDDFFYRREMIRVEECERENKKK